MNSDIVVVNITVPVGLPKLPRRWCLLLFDTTVGDITQWEQQACRELKITPVRLVLGAGMYDNAEDCGAVARRVAELRPDLDLFVSEWDNGDRVSLVEVP